MRITLVEILAALLILAGVLVAILLVLGIIGAP